MMTSQFPDWVRQLPEADVSFPGASAWIVDPGAAQTVCWEFEEGGSVPAHAHAAQIGVVLDGAVHLTVDGEGRRFGPGEWFSIEAGQEHEARVEPNTMVIEVYADPARHRVKGPIDR